MVLPIPNMDKFQQLKPVSPADFQMMEARKWTVAEISRITGVPPEMLAESDKQSYGYSEQSAKSFVTNTLDPWLTKRDQELRKKLLTNAEKRIIRVESHVDETMWMLPKDRVEYWYKLFQMGAITANEIRAYLNMNPVPGGDQSMVQVNLAPLEMIGTIHNSNNNGNEQAQ
jgi:HK97 family phage portal protein